MKDSLKKMDGSKAASPDGFYRTVVKPLAEILVKHFTKISSSSPGEGWSYQCTKAGQGPL